MALTYEQALAYISSFDDPYLAAIRDHGKQTWGLDHIRARLRELGDPHLAYPTIHVAGTKGKGSTAAFITQALIESGLRTGLYVSPHLEDWRERISINREIISQAELALLVEDYQQVPTDQQGLSAFEVTTALAFWHFARQGCDIAVIEVGLGGRLDATSVVQPVVSVITNISLDHTQLLGDTLAQIAAEKAAIIKPGVPAVSGPQQPDALKVIEHAAAAGGSPLTVIGRDWEAQTLHMNWHGSTAAIGPVGQTQEVRIGLPGAFQIENAAVAMAALKAAQAAGIPVQDDAVFRGISDLAWKGRLEAVQRSPLVVLDSAHNPYSIGRLVESLRDLDGYERLIFVFGCMADKHADAMLTTLVRVADCLIVTQASHARAATPEDLLQRAALIQEEGRRHGAAWADRIALLSAPHTSDAVRLALQQAQPADAICIAGSLALAGEARIVLLSDNSRS